MEDFGAHLGTLREIRGYSFRRQYFDHHLSGSDREQSTSSETKKGTA
jgi:hypothetical protein